MDTTRTRALIDTVTAHRSAFHQDSLTLDGLKANQVDGGESGRRVRTHARKAEQTLLDDIKLLISEVGAVNEEIHDTAIRHAKIEQTRQEMDLIDSMSALSPALWQANELLIELTHLRTALLRTVISVASTLSPRDGRTIAADIETETLFPGGPDLSVRPEPDAVAAVIEGVDSARRKSSEQRTNLSDEEFAELLGAF
ncbi:MAG: hypothetical protein ACE37H_08025 [Phycisphaeraceae bacterium]